MLSNLTNTNTFEASVDYELIMKYDIYKNTITISENSTGQYDIFAFKVFTSDT